MRTYHILSPTECTLTFSGNSPFTLKMLVGETVANFWRISSRRRCLMCHALLAQSQVLDH